MSDNREQANVSSPPVQYDIRSQCHQPPRFNSTNLPPSSNANSAHSQPPAALHNHPPPSQPRYWDYNHSFNNSHQYTVPNQHGIPSQYTNYNPQFRGHVQPLSVNPAPGVQFQAPTHRQNRTQYRSIPVSSQYPYTNFQHRFSPSIKNTNSLLDSNFPHQTTTMPRPRSRFPLSAGSTEMTAPSKAPTTQSGSVFAGLTGLQPNSNTSGGGKGSVGIGNAPLIRTSDARDEASPTVKEGALNQTLSEEKAPSQSQSDDYDLLNVSPFASREQFANAYFQIEFELHPLRHRDDPLEVQLDCARKLDLVQQAADRRYGATVGYYWPGDDGFGWTEEQLDGMEKEKAAKDSSKDDKENSVVRREDKVKENGIEAHVEDCQGESTMTDEAAKVQASDPTPDQAQDAKVDAAATTVSKSIDLTESNDDSTDSTILSASPSEPKKRKRNSHSPSGTSKRIKPSPLHLRYGRRPSETLPNGKKTSGSCTSDESDGTVSITRAGSNAPPTATSRSRRVGARRRSAIVNTSDENETEGDDDDSDSLTPSRRRNHRARRNARRTSDEKED